MKRILVIVVVLAIGSAAQASELWWTVADQMSVDGGEIRSWQVAKAFANTTGSSGGSQDGDLVQVERLLDDLPSCRSFYYEICNGKKLEGEFSLSASSYAFRNFLISNVVPEPTSGLLTMLGMMMLGLKRKRV